MQQLLMQTEVLSLYLEGDAIISDSLNHASIDVGSVCKARYRYANNDMEDLEQQLIKANEAGSRFKIIVDGVFLWMVLLRR
jgi:glycine C-acetyltransferase